MPVIIHISLSKTNGACQSVSVDIFGFCIYEIYSLFSSKYVFVKALRRIIIDQDHEKYIAMSFAMWLKAMIIEHIQSVFT